MSRMEKHDSTAAISSLAMYDNASDSEEDNPAPSLVDTISDDEIEGHSKPPSRPPSRSIVEDENSRSSSVEQHPKPRRKRATKLVSYGPDDFEDEDELDEDDEDLEEEEGGTSSAGSHGGFVEGKLHNSTLNAEQASLLSRSVLNKSLDEIELPPEPPGKCPKPLQEKITRLYDRMRREGMNLNDTIQRRVDFRNPSIYEKLIEFCGIDEKGTNYPVEIFDPHSWGKESYYDALEKAQKIEMDKREKERKDRTKIEFVVGTKKSSSSDASGKPDEKKRKTKWDAQPSAGARAGSLVAAINQNLTTSATGTKATVILATGSIVKKAK